MCFTELILKIKITAPPPEKRGEGSEGRFQEESGICRRDKEVFCFADMMGKDRNHAARETGKIPRNCFRDC